MVGSVQGSVDLCDSLSQFFTGLDVLVEERPVWCQDAAAALPDGWQNRLKNSSVVTSFGALWRRATAASLSTPFDAEPFDFGSKSFILRTALLAGSSCAGSSRLIAFSLASCSF